MNYKWVRDFALELINQYSVAGAAVAPSYNNQADYLARIPKLVDDGQMYIATTYGRIRETVGLEELSYTQRGSWRIYDLPDNCWEMCSGGLIRFDGPELQRYHRYRPIGKTRFAVPRELDGVMSVEYFRYPARLGDAPKDSAPLDNSEEAQRALPYYVAAHLVMHDNSFAYASLYNEFEAKLGRLTEQPHADITVVEDAYSPEEWRYDA